LALAWGTADAAQYSCTFFNPNSTQYIPTPTQSVLMPGMETSGTKFSATDPGPGGPGSVAENFVPLVSIPGISTIWVGVGMYCVLFGLKKVHEYCAASAVPQANASEATATSRASRGLAGCRAKARDAA